MDFISDNNPKYLNKVESLLGEFPEYVKNANITEKPNIARGSFANSINKEFPVDTAENTYLSYAYFKAASVEQIGKNINAGILTKKTLQDWENKITNAGQIHGISEDLEKISNVLDQHEKKSRPSVSSQFALVIDFEKEGGVKYYYPIDNRENLVKSARELTEDIRRLPLEAFRTASHNIVKKAKSLSSCSEVT